MDHHRGYRQRRCKARCGCALALLFAAAGIANAGTAGLLAGFADAGAWQVRASDDVHAALRAADNGHGGRALCLDYRFPPGVAGYATMRRPLPLDFPAHYALQLGLRGEGPVNGLQLKFVDASGWNVWWYQQPAFAAPAQWTTLMIPQRAVSFAWGPDRDHTLRHAASLELTIAAVHGGHGAMCFDRLTLTRVPASRARRPQPPAARPVPPAALLQTLSRRAPRGEYPRGFSGEQDDWTVVGVDGGRRTALFSADGRLEPFKGDWSVEPFLLTPQGLIDWADVQPLQTLRDGYLPVPGVIWRKGPIELEITAFGKGTPAQAQLLARYTVRNTGATPLRVTLALALRPLQVNPPTQFLNTPGGFGPIHAIRYTAGEVTLNGDQRLVTLGAPSGFVVGSLARQTLPQLLTQMPMQQVERLQDDGLAQGALLYPLQLPPHGERSIGIAIPWAGASPAPMISAAAAARVLQLDEDAVAAAWQARLGHVRVRLPRVARHFQDTLSSALAQILLDRDGVALQPGTRSYARSWIRDGAMMSEALLRMGDAPAVRDYLLWYAPHQFSTGKVPCCVDWKGADPTPENDSQGELVFAIAEYTRYTHDLGLARQLWPHVEAAVRYMNQLRATQKAAPYLHGKRRLFYGLMPRSISHEGYSAKPMHSYWDDFWSLRGYRDAAWLAQQLGHAQRAQAYAGDAADFQKDFFASIRNAARRHHIRYIAGSADLGDFDPTSTTIALSPTGVQHELPQALLHATFARYWRNFQARADHRTPWQSYTPYEWRNVDAFLRLGWRDRIPPLLRFFFAGQRPAAWNQWAEVVWHDADAPHFIGDMPHAWVASDFLRSALDMLAYQRHRDHALVLAAGVPPAWLSGGGIRVEGLRTPWGPLSYTLRRRSGGMVTLDVPAGSALPPGGLVLTWPYATAPGVTRLDGVPATWRDGTLRITRLPARVEVGAKR
jgi:hypothetical protein